MMGEAVLDHLAAALAEEHQALIERDAQRLLDASQHKRDALQALAATPPAEHDPRLRELVAANRLNGALVTRRLRDVDLLLRHLGQHDDPVGYNARGQSRKLHSQRVLAVA